MLVRLLIGTAAEGSEEFSRRAKYWRAELEKSDPSRLGISPENETEAASLRYALIGLLFQSIDAGTNGLSQFNRAASTTLTTFSKVFAPLTRSRFWQPVKENFDASRERGELIVKSWMETGRREEQSGRFLARKQAYEDVIDDAIEYLAQKPEVSDLVQNKASGWRKKS